jgi:hypothetical protein
MHLLHITSFRAKNPQRFGDSISLSLQVERGEKEPILVGPQDRDSYH